MRYKSDIRTLITVLITTFLLAANFYFPINLISWIWIFPVSFLMFINLQINHNVMHVPIFKNEFLNICFNILISLNTAFPVTLLLYPHIVNHHPNSCNEKDWAGYLLVKNDTGLKRVFKYVILANLSTTMKRPVNIFQGLNLSRKISLSLEALTVIFIFTFGLKFHAADFLLFYFIPSVLAMNTLVFMNFYLHDGCNYNSENFNSKTFTGPWKSFLLFNNGYHQAHHINPKMHWSELPDFWHNKLHFPDKERYQFNSFFKHFKHIYLQSPIKNIN